MLGHNVSAKIQWIIVGILFWILPHKVDLSGQLWIIFRSLSLEAYVMDTSPFVDSLMPLVCNTFASV